MDRREFLKRTGFIGAGTAVGLGAASLDNSLARDLIRGGKSVSRTTGVPRLPIPTTCMMCPARCGVIGYLEQNVLVKIEGNPRDPNGRGKICAVGLAGFQYAYNPDRLLYPLKRVGARGEGNWQQVSWDEALNELGSRLKALRQQGETEKLVFFNDVDFLESLTDRFLSAFGRPTVIEGEDLYEANHRYTLETTLGVDEIIPDLAHSKYILNFGANPYEQNDYFVPLISRLTDARMNGAKLITFDPRICNTSGKSTEWYPLAPGSDLLVALAMANVIMRRGLYDREFVRQWFDVSAGQLARFLREFTPDMAESASGIKESHIRRIAVEFATTKPAVAIAGGGVSQQRGGVVAGQAVLLLNALTGNIDNPGGLCLPRALPLRRTNPAKYRRALPQNIFADIEDGKASVGLFLTHQCNPAFTNPDTEHTQTVLKNQQLIPYHVVLDSYLTETALLADLILPTSTYLESWGLHSPASFELTPTVILQQPVLRPKGNSRQFHQILLDVAKHIGGDFSRYFVSDKVRTYVKADAEGIEGPTRQEGGFEHFRQNGVWNVAEPPRYHSYKRNGFPTPTRKLSIKPLIREAPRAVQQIGRARQDPSSNEYVLILYQSAVQTDGRNGALMWLSEIEHNNVVWMNRVVARSMAIEDGDEVRLSTETNSIIGKVRLTSGIHPRAVAMNQNLGHWACGRVARAEKFESSDPNTGHIWWAGSSESPHAVRLIGISSDPLGNGQAWNEHRVRIEKV